MTKLRSREECLAAIQNDSAWRKKEIVQFGLYVRNATSGDEAGARRLALVMLYAHWEGFVKNASLIYLKFINEVLRRRKGVKLISNFDALRKWSVYRKSGALGSVKTPNNFIKIKWSDSCEASDLLPEDVIDTESNLSSTVLRRLMELLSLDFTQYELKANLIDKTLLANRNGVAHGERIAISASDYAEAEDQLRDLISDYQKLIEDAVSSEIFIEHS